jgi:hypothetical protein
VLQKALDQRCSGNKCNGLKIQTSAEATKCAKAQAVKEPYDGCKLLLAQSGDTTDKPIKGSLSFLVECRSLTLSFLAQDHVKCLWWFECLLGTRGIAMSHLNSVSEPLATNETSLSRRK